MQHRTASGPAMAPRGKTTEKDGHDKSGVAKFPKFPGGDTGIEYARRVRLLARNASSQRDGTGGT